MKTSKYTYSLQQKIEETFGKRFIHKKAVDDLLATPEIANAIEEAVPQVYQWLDAEHWDSKQARIDLLKELDIHQLITDVLALVCLHARKPMKLVSIASMAAKYVNMASKVDAIQTMAEFLAVISEIDLIDILCDRNGTRWVLSKYELDQEVLTYAFHAMYLPPMLIKPRKLRNNRDSGYITQRGESLILGYFENHHDDDICLDVLNTQNANEYELDQDFISSYTEEWHRKELTPQEYAELSSEDRLIYEMEENTWNEFNQQGYKIQTLMLYHGNSFYLQNKVDKRGRIYTSGYHISPQGSSFKKAMVNLKLKQICTGVDQWKTAI